MDKQINLSKKRWIYLIFVIILFLGAQIVPYKSSLSILFQIGVIGITILFYYDTPCVSLAAILFLYVVPSTTFYATNSEFQNHYQLNNEMVTILCIFFLLIKLVQKKGKIKARSISIYSTLFGILLLVSVLTAGKTKYYTSNFYTKALMYIAISWFIETPEDIEFSLFSFLFAGATFVAVILAQYIRAGTIYSAGASANRNYLALFDLHVFFIALSSIFIKYEPFDGLSCMSRATRASFILILGGKSVENSDILDLTSICLSSF